MTTTIGKGKLLLGPVSLLKIPRDCLGHVQTLSIAFSLLVERVAPKHCFQVSPTEIIVHCIYLDAGAEGSVIQAIRLGLTDIICCRLSSRQAIPS